MSHEYTYRVSRVKLLKLIGNYFEMLASIKMTSITFKRRRSKVFFVNKFIMINNILKHSFNIFQNR